MKHKYYRLNAQNEPEPCSMGEWAFAFELQNRIVAVTEIGPIKISTVFLGLDHSFTPDGPPKLWETMVFGGPHDQEWMDRCAGSREQAEAMHAEMVKRVDSSLT
jgi:hypothetical protein